MDFDPNRQVEENRAVPNTLSKSYHVEKEAYGASITAPENISWFESIPQSFKLKVRRRNRPND